MKLQSLFDYDFFTAYQRRDKTAKKVYEFVAKYIDPKIFRFFFQIFLSKLREELYSPFYLWQEIPERGETGMA